MTLSEQDNSAATSGAPTREASPSTVNGFRIAGYLAYTLPDGSSGAGVQVYAAKPSEGVPTGTPVNVVCNHTMSVFIVTGPRKGQGGIDRYCAYFERGGKWFFFYTEGATLPEGSHITVQL
jgi:hypothetical protein